MAMKVVVLGPNGQLGTDVIAKAGPFECIPLARDRLDAEQLDRIPEVLRGISFDALVNCTGYHKTDDVEQHAERAYTVNAHAVRRLAEVCATVGARFVHVSTDYVFAGDVARPYVEEDRPGPLNVYGASKLMGEVLARTTHEDTLVLRVASLFGVAGSRGKGGNFVETMLRIGREKGELRVVNDVTMSPTSTSDVAGAALALLERAAPPGVYHVVNSGQATWHEFAHHIIERAGVQASVAPVSSDEFPTVARRPAYSVLDNRKAADVIGAMPSWQDALDRYLRAKGYRT
jgi:dTDP-4-dehydrorhamnose reductase